MGWKGFLDRLAPDLGTVLRRFPLAILLAAAATAIAVAGLNDWLPDREDFWARLFVGLATGAVFSVAGPLFGESRPGRHALAVCLSWALPAVVVLSFLPRDTHWFVPFALPVVGLLWLAVSPVTIIGRGTGRDEMQDRFWWLVNRAVTSAAVAGAAFGVLALGTMAIERSLAILFGLETRQFFYRGVLPVVGLFFVPLYWLATLPRANAYEPRDLADPDFTARAAGFLGPYILVPVLLAYAGILLLYCLQTIVTLALPNGMLGWMVMGFTITGAAAYLVLHPAFLRDKPVVRFFRKAWWGLTLLPLALFTLAVWVRIDAYGLTPERVGLAWGGLWAGLVALAFLLRLGDIRLIPALAAAILLLATIGPWNPANLSRLDQARRLELALSVDAPDAAVSARARSAIGYLAYEGDEGRAELRRVIALRGLGFDPDRDTPARLALELGFQPEEVPPDARISLWRDRKVAVDVAGTPSFLGTVSVYGVRVETAPGLSMRMEAQALFVAKEGEAFGEAGRIDLTAFIARQGEERLSDPALDFIFEGRRYRLVVDDIQLDRVAGPGGRQVYSLSGTLFGS